MIGDIISRQAVVLKADASQFKAEMKSAGAVEQKVMKDRLDGMEKQNTALDTAGKKLGLYAAAGAAAYALISSSVKKYEEHLKSLGASGEAELKRIHDMTGRLTKAQDSLQIALAKVFLAAEPLVTEFATMAQELANVAGGIARVVAEARNFVPGGGRSVGGASIGTWVRRATPGVAQLSWLGGMADDQFGAGSGGVATWFAMRELERERAAMGGDAAEFLGGQYGNWQQNPALNPFAGTSVEARARARADAARRRRGGGGFQLAATESDGASVVYSDNSLEYRRLNALAYSKAFTPRGELLDQLSGIGQESRDFAIAESMRKALEVSAAAQQRESLLESVFGPVEEFKTYQTAWQGLETVVTAGFEAWIDGSKSVGQAMKEALHGFAKQLAGEALLQALRHGAYALGSLAFGDPRGAAQHGIAAAKWAGVAALAGVVGKASAPSQGAGAGSSYASAGGIGGRGGSGANYGGGGGSQAPTYIVLGDSYGYESERSRNQRFRSALNTAGRSGGPVAGVQHS